MSRPPEKPIRKQWLGQTIYATRYFWSEQSAGAQDRLLDVAASQGGYMPCRDYRIPYTVDAGVYFNVALLGAAYTGANIEANAALDTILAQATKTPQTLIVVGHQRCVANHVFFNALTGVAPVTPSQANIVKHMKPFATAAMKAALKTAVKNMADEETIVDALCMATVLQSLKAIAARKDAKAYLKTGRLQLIGGFFIMEKSKYHKPLLALFDPHNAAFTPVEILLKEAGTPSAKIRAPSTDGFVPVGALNRQLTQGLSSLIHNIRTMKRYDENNPV